MSKIPFLVGLLSFASYRLTLYLTGNIWLSLLILLIPISLLVMSFLYRKSLNYSKWFLSPMNVLIDRTSHSTISDISTDLLYEKLLEVANDTHFTLLDKDNSTLRILMGTTVNFWTWGENIYIQLEPSHTETVIHFTSVTLFGNTSWKRNDKHFESFIESFESSLTI
jgi:hypothetical protein